MSFYLETTDVDFGDTSIENIFINDFMPMADGTYVKVYLLAYKYACDRDDNIRLDNMTIAKHLRLPLSDVLSAWDFWEKKGIVEKLKKEDQDEFDYEVRFLNLKQLNINNNYRTIDMESYSFKKEEKYSSFTTKDLLEVNQMPRINQMFNNIDYTIRRPLVPNEKKTILEWLSSYNMNPDIVEKAFFHAMEKKGKRDIRYVGGIIKNWYSDGITTIEAYQEMLRKNNDRYFSYNRILKALGVSSVGASDAQKEIIDKWLDQYKMSLELILEACSVATSRSNTANFNYIDKILTDWHEQGITTVEEIQKSLEKKEEIDRTKPSNTNYRPQNRAQNKPNRFHNFNQRTSDYSEDDLERIAENKRQEYFNKIKGEV